ncbi:bifunctional enoyl-CoA hydratase/phosphate acetyltransferase [Ectothiorhodospira haloalkaliphila]|uniref:Bifunctional enoyl-CoA hydratase/phosphate acetyltransferase n=1 Tax=Ectothiorhodospira haloalkaliphila TaxID=421628 RepID=W8KGR9_9GAMM|nr:MULTISPECIES: bifunctional enoyl-CoA hydratase/phosphate acetyltransferase [Ectothiorhodospira]AHK78994.1 bifunctional enoyl-CoA hydratase/phosphate acetyltransferase [Ectothiorhodospira haloalkaliphila]MCG5493728.1 bifunctional enoyl-CoA hydratase/phosphate acetyltransferase [Ectothiorhodospira variabilis]MCG5497819.1 bifunctional enoyl-CoA hydratase/phosphate acetyltransferase [Ectothiorhodospira variabilis]MCG5503927.1 bifunctional enoyl-CoA hydratase/phosphate acetyltransferase [Ectothio
MDKRVEQDFIENRTFDEIQVGDSATIERRLTMDDIKLFAIMSGDVNPAHVDEDFAKSTRFQEIIAHGMWGGALISTVLGTELPGPGTIYLGQTLRFKAPVGLGDVLRVHVKVLEKDPGKNGIKFDCRCTNQDDRDVIVGVADVLAPTEKIRRPRTIMPRVRMAERARLHELLHAATHPEPVSMAVVHPVDTQSILGAYESARAGLIHPVLIGPEDRIRAAADEAEVDISDFELVPVRHSHAAAEEAVSLTRSGRIESIMKGSLHTDELLRAVLARESGLRTERRISHVMAFDVPTYPRPLFITDAAINIYPSLADKMDIVQNAIDLAHAVGNEDPKVAILSALETVNPKIQSTLEAAALCKMAERGQITGGTLDGPLAFDNAVSEAAAKTKNIVSPVAGKADILLAPDLEAANMLMKQLTYLADATGAGIVLGARVPIVLTSRADDAITRMASCALALLAADYQKKKGR